MATYTQWRRAADNGEVRRVTWVCGDQRVLVEEVVDHVRTTLGVSDLDYVSLSAGAVPDRDVWAAAHQYPMLAGNPRLVLVRDAERIRNWEPLTEWLASTRCLPTNYLLFVSNDTDFAYQLDRGRKVGMKAHLEAIKARGHIVRCTMPNEADAVAWVRRRAPLDTATARHLLARAGADLGLVAGVCAKLRLFDGAASPATINALCAQNPSTSIVDALLFDDKPRALHAAQRLRHDDYASVIATLSSRLDLMAALWRCLRSGHTPRQVQTLPVFLVKQYLPAAKHYDPKRCTYSRRVLAVVEEAHRSGARDAVLEVLVALW